MIMMMIDTVAHNMWGQCHCVQKQSVYGNSDFREHNTRNVRIYTVRQKKGTTFLLCASLLILDRSGNFFSYILRNV